MRSLFSGIVWVTLPLLASAAALDCSSIQQSLKGPKLVSYQMVTKDQKVAGQVIKGKTSVMTSVTKPIPNGVQVTMTSGGKDTVVKNTCVGGKLVTYVDGKKLDLNALQKEAGITNIQTAQVSTLDHTKHKVGETWSGTLSSHDSAQMSMKTTFKKKLVALEKVKTPAGTFEAYRVEQKTTTTVTLKDKSLPADLAKTMGKPTTVTTTEWYAKSVPGLLVKSTSDAMNMTLVKYQK